MRVNELTPSWDRACYLMKEGRKENEWVCAYVLICMASHRNYMPTWKPEKKPLTFWNNNISAKQKEEPWFHPLPYLQHITWAIYFRLFSL